MSVQKITKQHLYQHCLHLAEEAVGHAGEALQLAEESGRDETKSSAGDKYETGREMARQEVDRNTKLLFEARQRKAVLLSLKGVDASPKVRQGSVVYTDKGNFYLSISLGQVTVDGHHFFVVSPVSPIGKILIGSHVGEVITFRGERYVIESIV